MATREKRLTSQLVPFPIGAETRDRKGYLLVKRVIDIAISALLLAMLAPLLVAVAVLIKLDSPGPVFFSHKRVGYDRRRGQVTTFKMHKFRSMFHNSDQTLHQQRVRDWIKGNLPSSTEGNGTLVKLTGDPRVTRVGRVIRRTSIDELPQLWNVLVGEMSLVGPRPVPPYEAAEYQPWHRLRLEAVPGITCLWQVRGRGVVGIDEMVNLDLEYIERSSLGLDVKILLQTIPVVLSGRGAA